MEVEFRIQRFDKVAEAWTDVRYNLPSANAALVELGLMLSDNSKAKLQVVQITREVIHVHNVDEALVQGR